jgi:hypothetical protein
MLPAAADDITAFADLPTAHWRKNYRGTRERPPGRCPEGRST